jgi:hypothetical protein
MGEVIPFPTDERDFKKIATWIRGICVEAGLTTEMADAVVAEYKGYHQNLFDVASSKLAMPKGLTEVQVSQIGTTVREFHTKKMGDAALIIIGLLARNQLNAG